MTGKLVRGSARISAAGALLLFGGTAAAAVSPAPPVGPPSTDGATAPVVPLPLTLPDVRPAAPPARQPEPGSAAATGVGVAPLDTCVACTSAGSTPGTEHAGATAVRVLGLDIASGKSAGDGAHSGALLAIPANPLLSLALGQWAAQSRSGGSSASKSALIAFVILPAGHDEGGTATICVIDTSSDSHDGGRKSSSSGELADADIGSGAITAQLAHSDASEDGSGKAYVVGVNQNEVISSDQTTQGLPIKIPGVDVAIVHKRASDADTEAAVAAAETEQAAPDLGSPVADAFLASAASPAQGSTVVNTPSTGSTPGLPATGGAGGLGTPSTGTALGLGGLFLSLAGAALTALSLRRRTVGG
jgi:hypothetical protein